MKEKISKIFKKIDNLIPSKTKKHIPNILTASRFGMATIFIGAFIAGNMPLAVLFFASAALTDAFDGALARHWKVESKWGKKWDPVADKLLVISALLLYGFTYNALMLLPLIFEGAISTISLISNKKHGKVDVNKAGKIKTITLMSTISLAILSTLFKSNILNNIVSVLTLLNVPLQSKTFVEYIKQYNEPIKQEIVTNNALETTNNKDKKVDNTKSNSNTSKKELSTRDKIDSLKDVKKALQNDTFTPENTQGKQLKKTKKSK